MSNPIQRTFDRIETIGAGKLPRPAKTCDGLPPHLFLAELFRYLDVDTM